MAQRLYLLDTSAFRALSAAVLEAAASEGRRLVASPFCFWELLTHLEDEGQFRRIKGNLMKFRHVSVLDDPWASVERELVPVGDAIHQRPDDCELVYATLAALYDSASMEEFYVKYICDSRSQVRQIAGCVARARDVLKSEEQKFQEFVTRIMEMVRDGHLSLATPIDRHRGTLQLVDAWWIQLGNRVDQSEALRERLIRRTYVYSSYVLHLALNSLERGATQIDRNDFEDAKFCQHLALDPEMTAVTDDAALRQCLQDTLAVLNALPDASYSTKLQVSSVTEFRMGLSGAS